MKGDRQPIHRRRYLLVLATTGLLAGCGTPAQQTPTATPTRSLEEIDRDTTPTHTQPPGDSPSAAFSFSPESPTVGDTVTFDAEASDDPDGEIIEYRWDFDGDDTIDSVTQVPTATHEYGDPGTYVAVLEVEDDDGATDVTRAQVTVAANPVAQCSVSATGIEPGESVVLDASGSNAEVVRFDIDGDGDFERTNQGDFREEVTYPDSGTFTPVVQAVIGDETDSIECSPITVNRPPRAAIDAPPDERTVDQSVEFDAGRSVDPDGEIIEYRWDFDGDGSFDSVRTVPSATTSYEEPGTYRVTLEVEDNDGAIGRTQTRVRVVDPPPVDVVVGASGGLLSIWILARIYRKVRPDDNDETNRPPVPAIVHAPRNPAPRRPVVFDGSLSTDPDPDDEIANYHWSLPDRDSNAPRFVHAFLETGDHDVELTVSDNHEASATQTETVTVEGTSGKLELERVHPDAPGVEHERLDEEYLVFANAGEEAIGLGGWTVHDAAEEEGRVTAGDHTFVFPDGFDLDPGATVTVHTGSEPDSGTEYEAAGGDRHLFWGKRRAVWNNVADVVVVEDDENHPVMARRYERTETGEYEIEDLDDDVLVDWFATAEALAPDQGIVGRFVSGVRTRLAAIAGLIKFVSGALFLRGPGAFLEVWGVVTLYLLLSALTWWVTTSGGLVARSVEPLVPVLMLAGGLFLLSIGGVVFVLWRVVSFIWDSVT